MKNNLNTDILDKLNICAMEEKRKPNSHETVPLMQSNLKAKGKSKEKNNWRLGGIWEKKAHALNYIFSVAC
jgi:hypothetical protein